MKISRKIAIIALLPIAAFVLQSARITHAINQAGTGHYGLQGESFFLQGPQIDDLRALEHGELALVHRRTAELLAQSSTEIGVTLATLILTLLVLTFLTRWLAGQITRPLAELGEGMKNSDLTLSLKANSQDEIGEALLLKVGLFRV